MSQIINTADFDKHPASDLLPIFTKNGFDPVMDRDGGIRWVGQCAPTISHKRRVEQDDFKALLKQRRLDYARGRLRTWETNGGLAIVGNHVWVKDWTRLAQQGALWNDLSDHMDEAWQLLAPTANRAEILPDAKWRETAGAWRHAIVANLRNPSVLACRFLKAFDLFFLESSFGHNCLTHGWGAADLFGVDERDVHREADWGVALATCVLRPGRSRLEDCDDDAIILTNPFQGRQMIRKGERSIRPFWTHPHFAAVQ
jgi:hypothetical protein